MKKTVAFIIVLLSAMLIFAAAAFADEVNFIKSPDDIEIANHLKCTISWEIDRELGKDDYFLIQERDDESWPWGNVEIVKEPSYTITDNLDRSLQYRIQVMYGGKEYYSKPFTVTWSKASDITTVEIYCPEIGDVPRGSVFEPLPITITNTGKYDLRITSVEEGWGSLLHVIENKPLKVLKAGESDSTSYSLTVRTDFPVDEYWYENVYVSAENLEEDARLTMFIRIVDSDEAFYRISVEAPDFGEGSTESTTDYLPLIIKNTGTAALTDVRIVEDDDSRNVFDIMIEGGWIEFLGAGEDTGDRIKIAILGGNDAGLYERKIKIYANEISEPYIVTLSGTVAEPEATDDPGLADDPGLTVDPGSSGEKDNNSGKAGDMPGWVIPVIIVLSVLLIGAVAAVIVLLVLKKKS